METSTTTLGIWLWNNSDKRIRKKLESEEWSLYERPQTIPSDLTAGKTTKKMKRPPYQKWKHFKKTLIQYSGSTQFIADNNNIALFFVLNLLLNARSSDFFSETAGSRKNCDNFSDKINFKIDQNTTPRVKRWRINYFIPLTSVL